MVKPFVLLTDAASLKTINTMAPPPNRFLTRILAFLQTYQYHVYLVDTKSNCIADMISRAELGPAPAEKPFETALHDENFLQCIDMTDLKPDRPDEQQREWAAYAMNWAETPDREFDPPDDQLTTANLATTAACAATSETSSSTETLENYTAQLNSTVSLKAEQLRDPFCSGMIKYLTSGQLPEDSNVLARTIVASAEFYAMDDDLLCRAINCLKKLNTDQLLAVVPENLHEQLITETHINLAHAGVERLVQCIKQKYFVQNLLTKCMDHVKRCLNCQAAKPTHIPKSPLKQIRSAGPFHTIHIDIGVINNPVGPNGERYILAVIDSFSRFLVLIPLCDIKAVTVAQAIFSRVLSLFGFCSKIISDRGAQFVSEVFSHLATLFDIRLKNVSA